MSEAVTGAIVDCTVLSSTFPSPIVPEISRDAILNLIDDFFASNIQLVTLEGKPDVGKTRIVAQFAKRHPSHSISVFIKPNSWFMQDSQLLYTDVAAQMYWALNKSELTDPHAADDGLIRRLSFDLQRLAKHSGQVFYFLVDGIEDLVDGPGHFANTLLAILPAELSAFRFLFSGEAKWLPVLALSQTQRKSYPVSGFSLEETTTYFSGYKIDRSDIQELYSSCSRGMPGYLASARRLIEGGMSPATLISQLPQRLPNPFQIEWRTVVAGDESLADALAILCYDSAPHSVSELGAILNTTAENVRQQLSACGFIELPKDDVLPVQYVSNSFRSFATDQLGNRREAVWEQLVEYFLRHKDTERARSVLPAYLEKVGKVHELLAILSPETFVNLAEHSDSFIPLQRESEIGLSTAIKLKKPGDTLRFGMQLSAVADVSPTSFARAEVIARMAMGDYDTALALAQSSTLKHQRLQLLAAIARCQREKGLSTEQTVLDSIETLADQIDIREVEDDVVGLATDLMYSRPDLAIKLVSRVRPHAANDRKMDFALLYISAVASMNQQSQPGGLSGSAEDFRERIKDPAVRRFSSAISILVGDYSVPEILHHVETLQGAGDRIFLLRNWCVHSKEPELSAKIIDYAVHLAIRTTEYTPTATDFKDLATPLPKVAATTDIEPLLTAFDIQKEAAKRIGPTRDYIQLQLLLGQAEHRLSPERAGQRLVETYYDVRAITDLELRVTCMALILAASPMIDPHGAFADTDDVRKLSESEFDSESDNLLNNTADHYVITKSILDALAKNRPEIALRLADQLNTEPRRDSALEDIVDHILDQPAKAIPVDFLKTIIGKFGDPDEEDSAVRNVLKRLSRISNKELFSTYSSSIGQHMNRARAIINPVTACEALSSALVILHKMGDTGATRTAIESSLKKSWQSIDSPIRKLQSGYEIVTTIAEYSRDIAQWFLSAADETKASHIGLADSAFTNSLRLAIRAFSGLLPRQMESDVDLERLTTQIERIPSRMVRVWLWSDFALRCFATERSDNGKKAVSQRIKPLLESLHFNSEYEWERSIVNAAPALYETNSATTMEILASLRRHVRDDAINRIIRFKLSKVPPWEPFDPGDPRVYQLDYDECLEILRLAESLDADAPLSRYLDEVANSANWRHNRHPASENQKNQLSQTIRAISQRKFPNARYIKHDGFAILGEAQALRLLREKYADWNPLLKRARALQNKSDLAYVLAALARDVHSGLSREKLNLLREAKSAADAVPSTFDRVDRLRIIGIAAVDIDKGFARSLAADAMNILKNTNGEDADEARREIVDLAYQIDPDLAESLASSLDDDEARRAARERLGYQELKKHLLDATKPLEPEQDRDEDDYSAASWNLLGYLNSGRAEPREVSETLKFVRFTSERHQGASFQVLSWVIQNAIVKRAHADESRRLVRELFDSTMSASEITAALINRAAGKAANSIPRGKIASEERTIVDSGERDRAIEYLREWLRDNGKDFLKICDPYFGPKELEVLQLVLSAAPNLQVTIVTSRRQQEQEKVQSPPDEYYLDYWRRNFSQQQPPSTEFVVVGGRNGELPTHDRWWLTEGKGLRFGSSFSGLGKSRDSEISELSPSEIAERLQITEMYSTRQKHEHLGERLTYQFFYL